MTCFDLIITTKNSANLLFLQSEFVRNFKRWKKKKLVTGWFTANQNDENDVMVASKLVEIDVIEDENKKQVSLSFELLLIFILRVRFISVFVLQEPEKSESSDGSREVDVSIGETDQTLGMNIETFRMKLVSQ